MSVEVICALIAVIGVVLSAFISWCVSRLTTENELNKLKLTWEREDTMSSDGEIAEMAAAVTLHMAEQSMPTKTAARMKVASLRAKESGQMGVILDELYADLDREYSFVEETLSKVIEQKRKEPRNRK